MRSVSPSDDGGESSYSVDSLQYGSVNGRGDDGYAFTFREIVLLSKRSLNLLTVTREVAGRCKKRGSLLARRE